MKLFLKILGYTLLSIVLLAYLAFLFVLPRAVDLNAYKELAQKMALEQADLTVDFSNVQIVTTPLLEAGVKISDLSVKLPDGSELISTDRIKIKLSLPNLFLLTVRVSEIAIDNPKINIEIESDGSQYKIMKVVEDIINKQKQAQEVKPPVQDTLASKFDPAWIKYKVPNLNISNYSILVNDLSSKHSLTLKGEKLHAAMFNLKTVKVKTNAEFLSDDKTNINANIDIDTVIPQRIALDEEDDPDYRVNIAFVNPVQLYRNYDLKTDINTKLKVRQNKKGFFKIKGFFDIEDLTMNLSGYQLPKSFLRANFHGYSTDLNTNLYITENENINISGYLNYSKRPRIDLNINSKQIHFNNLIILSKAFMDTLSIKNDLKDLKGTGYITANAKIKTNFKKLRSNGAIIVRNGGVFNKNNGIKNINANILFKDKVMKIVDAHLNVNDAILQAAGQIDEKAVADISIYTDKLPLAALFHTFAPIDLKRTLDITSGTMFLEAKLQGELKKAITNINLVISNLALQTKDNSVRVNDDILDVTLQTDLKNNTGKITNSNLKISLPQTKSQIFNPYLNIVIDPENITLDPFDLEINSISKATLKGFITNYMKKPEITLGATGDLNAVDLRQFLGDMATTFIDAKGSIPFKLTLSGNDKRQKMRAQVLANSSNYITPLHIDMLQGKNSIGQIWIDFKGNRLTIKDTGLYTKDTPIEFGDDLDLNLADTQRVSKVSGTIKRINSPIPYINQIKVDLPRQASAKIYAFPNSLLNYGGNLIIFGHSNAPKFKGDFRIWDLTIPELYTSLKNFEMNFAARKMNIKVEDLLLNGSDIQVKTNLDIVPEPIITINDLDISSRNIDLEKIMKVSDSAMKYMPKSSGNTSAQSADIPVRITNGTISLARVSVSPLVLTNTRGDISLNRNVFYLNNLLTNTLGGRINGDVSANILTLLTKAKIHGENFDVERALLEVLNMKDAISGIAEFDTDLTINGAAKTPEEQMKGFVGNIDFNIQKGQLGPFGHLENMILAENIRESAFFQTALGEVINNLTSIQTSHFDELKGHITLEEGIAKLNPITSLGPVMCLHIAGDINLLNNQADMTLRARLGSKIADMLGPLAAVNPINLVKATPGLNVAAAKTLSIFCVELTQEELDAIPNFKDDFNNMSTTSFQLALRGDTQKPLSLIKSFKWLATASQIAQAENFVSTLPPADETNPNATLEEILAAQAEAERLANENIFQKSVRKVKDFFGKFKKEKEEK